jgi:hypothetical protein
VTGEDVEAIWQAIEQEGHRQSGWHGRKISRGSPHDLLAGRRMPSGSVGLLYDLDASSVPPGTEWPEGKGFRTQVQPVTPGPNGRLRVALELSSGQYRDVFSSLCADIAGVIMEHSPGRSGFGAFLRRLQAWQRFMQLHSDKGLSQEAVRGLFAEVTVLEQILYPMLGEAKAVETWQGPHALHDFECLGHALEVKSGSAGGDPVMRVSQLDQFDETAVRSLHVCFVPLATDSPNGESLPDLVARHRARLRDYPGALQRFEDLLVAAGYHESQSSNYSEPRLRSTGLQLFRVRDDFPRLRRDDVHGGIVAGKYSVSVNACSDFHAEPADLEAVFAGGVDVD